MGYFLPSGFMFTGFFIRKLIENIAEYKLINIFAEISINFLSKTIWK